MPIARGGVGNWSGGNHNAGPGGAPMRPPSFGGGFPGMPQFPGGGMAQGGVGGGGYAPGYSGPMAPGGMPPTGGGFGAPGAAPGATAPGMPGSPPTFGAGSTFTNTSDPSKNLTWLEEQYKARLGQDPTKHATEKAVSAIRDLATGQGKELTGNLSRRGMLGGGVEQSARGELAGNVQRAGARAASDIAMGREKDIDQMTLAGLPIMGAQGQLDIQNKSLANQQYGMQQQGDIAKAQLQMQQQQMAMQQQQAAANLWSTYLNMYK